MALRASRVQLRFLPSISDAATLGDCARSLADASAQAEKIAVYKAETAQTRALTLLTDTEFSTGDSAAPPLMGVEPTPHGVSLLDLNEEPPLDTTPAQSQALCDAKATAASDDAALNAAIRLATIASAGPETRGLVVHAEVFTAAEAELVTSGSPPTPPLWLPPCFLFGSEADGFPQKALSNTIGEVISFLCTDEGLAWITSSAPRVTR